MMLHSAQSQTNNDIVATKHDRQIECTTMVWELLAFIVKDELATYSSSKKAVETEATALERKAKELRETYKFYPQKLQV